MEAPREHHMVLFLTASLCMIMAVFFFVVTVYLVPFLVFGFIYEVPEVVIHLREYYESTHGYGGFLVMISIIGPFFIASVILGFIASRLTRKLEELEITPTLEPDQLGEEDTHFNWGALGPIRSELALIAAVILLLFLAEYMIVIDILD